MLVADFNENTGLIEFIIAQPRTFDNDLKWYLYTDNQFTKDCMFCKGKKWKNLFMAYLIHRFFRIRPDKIFNLHRKWIPKIWGSPSKGVTTI